MSYIDEFGNYTGPTSGDPAAKRAALTLYRQGLRNQQAPADGRENQHHAVFRRICSDQLLYRAGLITADECHPDADLTTIPSAIKMARDFISLAGGIPPDRNQSLMTISRALGTSDFPLLLEDTANRALTLGYDRAPETWPLWTRVTTVKDFTPFSRITTPELPSPPVVAENGEIHKAQLGNDFAERGQLASHAEIVHLTREVIINDDLAGITTTMAAAGRAVARLLGDKCYHVLTANATMTDGNALYSGAHGNDATAAAPSVTAVGSLRNLMAAQAGPSGEVLNIRPRFLLGPVSYEDAFATIRATSNADRDPFSTGRLTTLTDGRLTGTAWYGVADPDIHDCVQIVLLEGSQAGPRFERRRSRNDGQEFLVGIDAAVLAVDWRTTARNVGA